MTDPDQPQPVQDDDAAQTADDAQVSQTRDAQTPAPGAGDPEHEAPQNP